MTEASMSNLDYHVLLAMAEGPRYGYAIRNAVEDESSGTLSPRAGTLYRVIARLMGVGFVREAEASTEESHPGRPRKYYALTPDGRIALAREAERLRGAAALAEERLGRLTSRP